MTPAERQDLEREISEEIGYRCEPVDFRDGSGQTQRHYRFLGPNEEPLLSGFGSRLEARTVEQCFSFWGPKWTTSEKCSAQLLEMMPEPMLTKYLSRGGYWQCDPCSDGLTSSAMSRDDPDRKLAIALAAAAWLESRKEGR